MSNPEFLYREATPLSLDDCGSVVIALVGKPTPSRRDYGDKRPWRVDTTALLKLTDCNRYIEWGFHAESSDEGFAVDKVDELERAVIAFAEQVRKAQKLFLAAKKEATTRNKNEGLKDE